MFPSRKYHFYFLQKFLKIASENSLRKVPQLGEECVSSDILYFFQILSNIHTVKVASVDRDQRTWSFNTRVCRYHDHCCKLDSCQWMANWFTLVLSTRLAWLQMSDIIKLKGYKIQSEKK